MISWEYFFYLMHSCFGDTTFTIIVAKTKAPRKKQTGLQIFMMWIISVMNIVCYYTQKPQLL